MIDIKICADFILVSFTPERAMIASTSPDFINSVVEVTSVYK